MKYSRKNPSPRYKTLALLYRRMHKEGEPCRLILPEQKYAGFGSLAPHIRTIKNLIDYTDARTLLDYGAGKGRQYGKLVITEGNKNWDSLASYWGGIEQIRSWDVGYDHGPFPEESFDGVVCTDVLEHCPEEDIDWILKELFEKANRFVFGNISTQAASAMLPDGSNAHEIQKPKKWWEDRIKQAARKSVCYLFILDGEKCISNGVESLRADPTTLMSLPRLDVLWQRMKRRMLRLRYGQR